MGLSYDLISQFVKVATPTTKSSTESTVYGTAVKYNDKMYVRLDGSDLLTPISTTADILPDERVTVMIKDHTATVTGNISSPSARTDDLKDAVNEISRFEILIANKVTTEELDAEIARIDTLVTENATIKEKLTAVEADIETLNADNVTINGKLTAAQGEITSLKSEKLDVTVANAQFATIENLEATDASIHNLEATYGDFADLTATRLTAAEADITDLTANKLDVAVANATYATIENLNASNANIDILKTGIADIETLIFGSASGTSIHTSFANAVIAQLGNAQIKSAMIESLSASKITAGDIYTNNVRVLSEDGRLLISDETIQISDATRVRVQIGKDAAGDYSINIWDANGKLMFSEGGITDSAIKDAIIRNDMVSDTANISAHKLNIDSLFEEINNGERTIKSAKILLDTEKQTLDVAFTALSGDVSSHGSSISVMQNQIASKVWKQDINAATNTMNTKFSALEQDVDSISATVSSHKTQLENLKIGGTNLIRNSTTLIFDDYGFGEAESIAFFTDEIGNIFSSQNGDLYII